MQNYKSKQNNYTLESHAQLRKCICIWKERRVDWIETSIKSHTWSLKCRRKFRWTIIISWAHDHKQSSLIVNHFRIHLRSAHLSKNWIELHLNWKCAFQFVSHENQVVYYYTSILLGSFFIYCILALFFHRIFLFQDILQFLPTSI